MAEKVLFARVGWMRWYRGVQADDAKPVGGGSYTAHDLGHEAFNFLPIDGRYLGYFQPQLQPPDRRKANPSTIKLQKIEPTHSGNKLEHVLVVFVATNPEEGGQVIVGWYRDATVYRFEQGSDLKQRNGFGYFVEAKIEDALLVPWERREFAIPRGKGGFGQANVCYPYDEVGDLKKNSEWIHKAVEYAHAYKLENAAEKPESASDKDIVDVVATSIEGGAGYQSNPRIRRAVEEYAMRWAERRLRALGLTPKDKHKTECFDFLCTANGTDLYVEVKGTQGDGRCLTLTPNEVEHARRHANSALFIVYDVQVSRKRNLQVLRW